MTSKKKSSVAGAAGPAAAKGFVPDAALQPVSISQPKLDCSDLGLDGDQELWLLQLPLDFPIGSSVSWEISEDPADGFRRRCTVQGVEYFLVPDEPALSADLYATPSTQHGSVVPVTRRMTVVRGTEAPMLCFGARDAAGGGAAVTAPKALPPADKKALKRKKAEQQQAVPAPVAPTIAAPRAGTAPAAPSKTGQAAPGPEGPRDASAAAPPAPEQQQQQQQPATEKKTKKRKAEEGEEGIAGSISGKKKKKEKEGGEGDKSARKEKKEKKDKSVKKEKKEKGAA